MRKAMVFCKYAKYIGLLGLPGILWKLPVFSFFWLFWLFGLVEIALNFPLFLQNLQMLAGMVYVPLKYGANFPNVENTKESSAISLPFYGPWVVVNGGVEKAQSHSWEVPSQRYAYDFLQLDANGKSFCGDPQNPASYYCYGQEILAPGDGIVIDTLNNQPDSRIDGKGAVDCAARDLRGNYILIQHTGGLYSLLAHLRKASICVAPGERVSRGQKIALCGNSGNSSEPHLHFQLQAGRNFFYSAGVPPRFEGIVAQNIPGYNAFDPRPTQVDATGPGFITRGQAVSNL